MNNQKFRGLWILVTGASSGIGEAFARSLASKGANLILVARSYDKLLSLKKQLEMKDNIKVQVYKIDLSEVNSAEKLYQFLILEHIRVDLLINNAGFGKQGRFERVDIDTCSEMVQLNIASVVSLTRLLLPGMLARRKGGIINLSSTAAFQPLPYHTLYSASKSFVLYFSEALWGEYYSRGINVLAVCPGHTRTNFHKRAGVNLKRLNNVSLPEDVVEVALDAYLKGYPFVVPGFFNHCLTYISRFLPRKIVIQLARNIFRPKFLGFFSEKNDES